jgi:hypothetical protein
MSCCLVVDAAEAEALPLEPDEDRSGLGRPPARDFSRSVIHQSGSRVRFGTSDVMTLGRAVS